MRKGRNNNRGARGGGDKNLKEVDRGGELEDSRSGDESGRETTEATRADPVT